MKDYKDYNKVALQDSDILKEYINRMFVVDNEEEIYNMYHDAIIKIRAIAEFNNYRVLANKISKNYQGE